MAWLQSPDYWISRLVVERGLALVYLIAFLVAVNQFVPLLGERGLMPAPRFLNRVTMRQAPSLFHWRYSDRLLLTVAWTGVALAAAIAIGLVDALPAWVSIPVWLALWALYLSIVNVGQTFYAFGWESLLLEAGFLAIFIGNARVAPPTIVLWLMRWLLFRVEFGAGLIKVRGDPCWRDLTCLYYHHETQPMPNRLSWHFHHLPRALHRVEVAGNHFAQLVVPFFLFAPQPLAGVAGLVVVATQGWLVLSGNFSWLNLVTIVLAFASLDDGFLRHLLPLHPGAVAGLPAWWLALTLAVGALIAWLSYRPVRNLVSRRQLMNFSFNPLHLVNTYGAFGSITRERYEVVVEGAAAPDGPWLEYEFKGKPGDPRRRPPQVAPYHLRLDWLMWFAAMSSPRGHPWFQALLKKLLLGDRATLRLLRVNPFPGGPPELVRARLYLYRFSTRAERHATHATWVRTEVGEYFPPSRLPASAATAPA